VAVASKQAAVAAVQAAAATANPDSIEKASKGLTLATALVGIAKRTVRDFEEAHALEEALARRRRWASRLTRR
jgi:hypothetical protein